MMVVVKTRRAGVKTRRVGVKTRRAMPSGYTILLHAEDMKHTSKARQYQFNNRLA